MIADVRGRFDPSSDYGQNLLSADGISWKSLTNTPISGLDSTTFTVLSAESNERELECVVAEFVDGDELPVATTRWSLALDEDGLKVETSLEFHRSWGADAVVLDVSCTQWLLVGLFDRGVVQHIRSARSGFASRDALSVFYTVGNGVGSLAVLPEPANGQTILTRDEPKGTVGLRLVRFGRPAVEDEWAETTWAADPEQVVGAGDEFTARFTVYANDLPFPTHAVDHASYPTIEDARTHFAAVYSTSATTLGGYLVKGSVYPTIAMPTRTYCTLHTFFDPDAWSTVGTLAFSGDPYLQREARRILERALGGITADGQIPHHFDGDTALYVAISGVAQTGPNLFWCLAALDYVCAMGDTAWLRKVWDSGLLPAADWVIEFFDPARKLLCVNGPLWVDVFRREGYTFDTNVTAVFVLNRMADAAASLGHHNIAERYRGITRDIREGLEALWDEDHYITARGRDWESIHDMIDSDNYLAVAFSVVDSGRSKRIIERMDRVPNMHPGGKGTWVSEVYYGPDECYGGNTGDSATGMGRLWWGDLMARQMVGDAETFSRMFEAVRSDQFELTWMRERYGSEGQMVRAPGYHEYPEILDKMLREGYYGVALTLQAVTINPMLRKPFSFRVGALSLSHSQKRVEIQVPGEGLRTYSIAGLEPFGTYRINGEVGSAANSAGEVNFHGLAGSSHVLELSR